jgi:head-tail adaptor
MRAGLLNEPVEIWEKSLVTNDYGEQTETWSLKYSTKARLVHKGGSRVIENSEVFYSHLKTFQVRYYVPVGEYDRVKWDNKYYRILNVEPDKERMNKTIEGELIDD